MCPPAKTSYLSSGTMHSGAVCCAHSLGLGFPAGISNILCSEWNVGVLQHGPSPPCTTGLPEDKAGREPCPNAVPLGPGTASLPGAAGPAWPSLTARPPSAAHLTTSPSSSLTLCWVCCGNRNGPSDMANIKVSDVAQRLPPVLPASLQ